MQQNLKNSLVWGFVLWVIGWVLGVVLFMTPAKPFMGWIITPIGALITLWVLFKKVDRQTYLEYFKVGIIWTIMAIILDYLFNVLLFNIGTAYYKLDIYTYYTLTLLLPLIFAAYKLRKKAG